MADGINSGLAHGTSGSPQITIENMEARLKAQENENIDFYGGENGKLLPAKYKNWIGKSIRDKLLTEVSNSTLRNAINQLYRPGAFIGNGGTASVIIFEEKTGLGLGKNGGNHRQKGQEMMKYIEKKILTQKMSERDKALAEFLYNELKYALGG